MSDDSNGWVVKDIIARLHATLGEYRRPEWRRFLADIGLRVAWDDLPSRTAAVVDMKTGEVIFRNGIPEDTLPEIAYEEGYHYLMDAGHVHFWRSRPQGHITVRKIECRARQFSREFPVSEDTGSSFVP